MTDTPSPAARPRRSLSRPIAALVLLAVVGGAGFAMLRGPEVGVVHPRRGEVVRTVVATGRVLAPYRVDIGSQITGVVAEVPVAEGQTVQHDQPLVRLDDAEARANVALATAALAQTSAKLKQIADVGLPVARENLAQAEANVAAADAAYERVEKLKTTGFATQAQIDDARKTRDVAHAQQRSARFQVDTNDVGGTERVMAEAALRQAEATLASARTRLAYTRITAPADGVLIARNVERGDVVQPGKVLMVLSPAGETQIVVQIDEKSMALLAVGNPAFASADAYADQRLPAELFYINPSVDPQTASIQVKLRVPNPPAWIRQDMTVSVDIEVARKADALVLPTNAVHDPLTTRPWVLVAEGGRAVRKAVKVGLRGDGRVEIVEGLTPDDAVVPVRAAVAEGERLRPRVIASEAGQGGKP
ncbi:MAG: efflux RND transporter periplasmic adaptor subunit [Siculibacillus sp.]